MSGKHKSSPKNLLIFCLATIVIGVVSGLCGMFLSLLLHSIQHIAYGYSPLHIISNESFLEGVRSSSSLRRVVVLTLCGLIAGLGWWLLYRFGKPLVGIAMAIKNKARMPILSTIIHALLQIITIALGSPLGREVAPREIGAVFADWFSTKIGLSRSDRQIMLACGAGAGLAAVYNVPLAGALFILEVLLVTWRWSVLLPALTTSAIAVVVSWIGLGNEPLYHMPTYELSNSLLFWSILTGPIFGAFAFWFIQLTTRARALAPHNWKLPVMCLVNFIMIGFLAIYFPALLGNGKSPVQLEFDDSIGISISLILLILRLIIVPTSLRAGAQGGLLTPSLANGALLAVVLGGVWNIFYPGTSLNAYAVIGATAFLAAAQKMPITAIALIFEFTHIKLSFLIPILFAVMGAIGMCSLCKNLAENKM